VTLRIDRGLRRAQSRDEGPGRCQQIKGYQRPDDNGSSPA
jgi:hypothetical protein